MTAKRKPCPGTRNGRHSWMAIARDGKAVIICSAPGCGIEKPL